MSYNKVLRQIVKRWYIVLIMLLVALVACAILRGIFFKKEYISTATCYVTGVYDVENGNDLTDGMLSNFINLSKTSSILSAVADDASIKMLGYSAEELTLALDIYRQNNLIVINCTMRDSIDSQLIAQAYLNTGLPKIKTFLNSDIQNFQYTIVSAPEEGKVMDSTVISIYLLSMLIGGMAGIFFALMPLLKGKVAYDYVDIQPMFNTQLLAVLPDKNLKQIGKNPIDSHALLTEYDAAVGVLISALAGDNCQRAMIVPCSENVQIAELMKRFAEISAMTHTTVVVDADFRHAKIDGADHAAVAGLSDYITGKVERGSLGICADNYTVLQCGNSCTSALPLLLSGYADELIISLSAEYESLAVVVPPINKYRDALSIGKSLQGAVLVIDCIEKSRDIKAAIDKLDQSGIKLLGIAMANYPKY